MSGFNFDIQRAALSSGAAFTARDLEERFRLYQQYAGNFPISGNGDVDPGEVYKFTTNSLKNFAAAELKTNLSNLQLNYIATSNGGRGVNLKVPEVKMLADAAAQLGGTALLSGAKEIFSGTSIDVPAGVEGIGMLAMDLILSGEPIGKNLGKAVATGIGTLAGAQIGMAVGTIVPVVGNLIGAAVGAAVSTIFGGLFTRPPPPPPPPINRKILEAGQVARMDQARFDAFNRVREEAVNSCKVSEATYWSNFDKVLYELSRDWSDAELELGFRFRLRWFDDTQGPAFYASPNLLRRIGAGWGYDYRSKDIDLSKMVTSVAEARDSADYYTYLDNDILTTTCRLSTMGCPYPPMQMSTQHPGASRFGEDDRYGTFNTLQTARAFAARGAIWVPQAMRMDCSRHIAYPTHAEFMLPGGDAAYANYIGGMADDQVVKNIRLGAATQLVSADLARTATIYRTYLESVVGKDVYSKTFNVKSLEDMFDKVKKANDIFNNVALASGIGVLGFSLWRAFK